MRLGVFHDSIKVRYGLGVSVYVQLFHSNTDCTLSAHKKGRNAFIPKTCSLFDF